MKSHCRYVVALALICLAAATAVAQTQPVATASGVAAGYSAAGAIDGDRFALDHGSVWKAANETAWWQVRFDQPRAIGAILQFNGDSEHRLENSATKYVWQSSRDGQRWTDLPTTAVEGERRLFRIHRLPQPIETQYLRLKIDSARGSAALREVEFYAATDAVVDFDDWILVVSSTEDPNRLDVGMPFVRLARQCPGWEHVPAQIVWHGQVDESLVAVEPRPLCAFFSGSFLEWCQRSREPWRGVQQVLASRRLPIWASCGGAQAMTILDVTGVDRPWDCPRCRNPKHPLLPVYSHIGHTGPAECGDYDNNLAERGKYHVRQVVDDPAFAGLDEEFEVMESHVGQIAYVPDGWTRIVTNGPGAMTRNQCLRVDGYPIYAAQFHIEMDGTPNNSRRIMSNFLRLARQAVQDQQARSGATGARE